MGAGIPAVLLPAGMPEVPVTTGLAGMAIAELYIQAPMKIANGLALASTAATFVADTKAGNTRIEQGIIGSATANSLTLSVEGLLVPEAYTSFLLQSNAVANDFGWVSFPWPRRRN